MDVKNLYEKLQECDKRISQLKFKMATLTAEKTRLSDELNANESKILSKYPSLTEAEDQLTKEGVELQRNLEKFEAYLKKGADNATV